MLNFPERSRESENPENDTVKRRLLSIIPATAVRTAFFDSQFQPTASCPAGLVRIPDALEILAARRAKLEWKLDCLCVSLHLLRLAGHQIPFQVLLSEYLVAATQAADLSLEIHRILATKPPSDEALESIESWPLV